MKTHWYRFGQKKGSYLSRNISYWGMFKSGYLKNTPHFGFSVNSYKYINWGHYFDRSEIEKIYKNLLSRIVKSKRTNGLYNYAKNCDKKIKNAVSKINPAIKNCPSNKELAKHFNLLMQTKVLADVNVPIGNFVVRTLSQAVEKQAEKYFPSLEEKQLKQKLLVLSYSHKETIFFKREKELLELAVKFKKYQKSSFVSLPPQAKKPIVNFHKKYGWMDIMFLIYNPTTPKDIWQEIKILSKTDPKSKLKELKKTRKESLRAKKRLLKNIRPSKKFLLLLKLLEESTWTETEIVKYFQLSSYYSLPFLTSIAKRLGINYQTLTNFSPKEVTTALKYGRKPSVGQLRQREKMFGFYFKKGSNGVIYRFFQDKQNLKRFSEDLKKPEMKIISGMAASPGVARGKIKIILDTSQLPHFKPGEILVTTMTTPNFVVAMKKAAAIVTNDGGITCHAAIVSRELKKPCVIGTRIATQIFKDGDFVEVDANKGIVRKIE